MAKYTVDCSECGANFKRTLFGPTKDRKWKLDQPQTCVDCWKKSQREKEEATPIAAEIYINRDGSAQIALFGNTRSKKDEIAALGYRWSEIRSGSMDYFSMKPWPLGWTKTVSLEALPTELPRLVGIVEKIENKISPLDLAIAAKNRKREEERRAAAAAIPQPVKPTCYPTGYWNGKIYGGPRIYVENKEVKLAPEDAAALRTYQSAYEQYRNRLAEALA